MATRIETTGKNLDEALFRALRLLDKRPDEITYEILASEAGEVRLRATVRDEDRGELPELAPGPAGSSTPAPAGPITSETVAQTAQVVLKGLLETMEVRGEVLIREHGTDSDGLLFVTLDVLGDDLGTLIGRRGETLRALQFITRLMVGKKLQIWARVNVDVEHYRVRREEMLRGLAERMAAQVRLTGEPVALEVMPPHERRIIHLTLRDNPHVTTKSYGEEGNRKVVISPAQAGPPL